MMTRLGGGGRKLAQAVVIIATALGGWWLGRILNPSLLVEGNSMEPTLHSGQFLFCNRSVPPHIARGAIVVLSRGAEGPCIKRVIGLPNETVSFCRGEVFIDGKMLREPYIPRDTTTFSWERACLRAGDDQYIVLGDNRLVSTDSREYGAVARSHIFATVDIPGVRPKLLRQPQYRIKLRHDPVHAAVRNSQSTPETGSAALPSG